MTVTTTTCVHAALALVVATAVHGQQATDQQRLDALRREIAALRGDSTNWLTEERAAEIRAVVTDVLADADTRATLQGGGATSGYSDGFFLSSSDGAYSMKINVLQQMRWSFNDNDVDQAYGFENKRTRLTFSGNMVDSSWTYKLGYYLGYSNSAENFGSNELADANVTKDFKNGFTVTGESACASPENFDAEIGRKIARANAVQKIWPLMGYALKSKLASKEF